ncbi:hypothetical protein, partial [Micromonospora sp. DT63]|uniref:hypothetical protein n=1 Tax=Micromonospora sp. DT63 TaxID=3393441 RepID=UPI003CF429A7
YPRVVVDVRFPVGGLSGHGVGCPVVGGTLAAESVTRRGRYTWHAAATFELAAHRSRREHPPGRHGYTPRTAKHHRKSV